ncbi:MAG: PDZ domain-containing protein [Planctomycetota bacterium]
MKTTQINFERLCVLVAFCIAFCLPVAVLSQESAFASPVSSWQEEDDTIDLEEDEDDDRRRSVVDRYSKEAPEFAELVRPVVGSVTDSTVAIMDGRKRVALGTIVDSNGFILTKASEMSGSIECRLSNGDSFNATVYGVDPETDLALLKIDADGLPAIQWSESQPPVTGQWLVSPNNEGEPVGIGVVSVDARLIPPTRAFLGIRPVPTDGDKGVLITEVIDGTPADRAGLEPEDIIIKIDEVEIPNPEKLRETLAQFDPNDLIKLTILRDEEEKEMSLSLANEVDVNPDFDRSNTQNSMGSRLSQRRRDFPMAVQHDSQLQANQCGGPIVDLSGQVVGLNIARGGRVFSLFLPVDIIEPVVDRLKTGEYSPTVVNADQITRVEDELKEIGRLVRTLPDDRNRLEDKMEGDEAREDEIKALIASLQERLEELEEERKSDRAELSALGRRIRTAEKDEERLRENLERLQNGS